MAKKKSDQASRNGKKMSLDQRIDNYLTDGRTHLTPRQLRRAAHKAHVSTAQVRDQSAQS